MTRRINFYSCLIFMLSFAIPGYGQEFEYRMLNDTDGLASNTVYSSFQDSKGFIWFTTESGVSRFDGYNFKNYTINDGLSDNEVFGAFEDSKGRIWFRTFNGRIAYWYKGRIINSTIDPGLKPLDSDSKIRAIVEDSAGNVWIAHERNYCSIYTNQNKAIQYTFGEKDHLYYLWINEGGEVCAILNKSIVKLSNGNTKGLDIEQVAELKNFRERFLFHEGKLIAAVGGKQRGINVFKNIQINKELLIAELFEFEITNFSMGVENDLWVCTYNGVYKFSDWHADSVTSKSFLRGNQLSSVLVDLAGNHWFTTLDKGVYLAREKNIAKYNLADGLYSESLISITEDNNGDVWLGHADSGLSRIDINRNITSIPLTIQNGQNLSKIRSITKSNTSDDLFVCASTGLYCLSSNGELSMKIGSSCVCFAESKIADKYFGTYNRFYKISKDSIKKAWSNSPIVDTAVSRFFNLTLNKRVNVVCEDDQGNAWLGCNDDLIKINGDSILSMKLVYNVFDCRIKDIKIDKYGNIWVATDGKGLLIYNNQEIISITALDGLSGNICNSIYLENNETAWVATNKGVSKVSLKGNKTNIKFLNMGDGLSSNHINDLVMIKDSLWLATAKGLNVFHRTLIEKEEEIPVMNITDFRVLGNSVLGSKSNSFSHKQNSIKIDFVGLAFNNNDNISYKYSLKNNYGPGLATSIKWQYTKNTMVEFPSLNPGYYTFLSSARMKNGQWSEEKVVKFIIKKPYWQNYWFIGFFAVLVIVGVWQSFAMYHHYNRKKALLNQRLLESKLQALRAQINPHFIFNALNSIQKFFMNNQVYDAQSYLAKFSRLMRLIVDNSDRNELTVDEEINVLKHYLDIEQLRVNNKFQYTIEVDNDIDPTNQNIPTMVIQPFVENAIWHGIMPMDEPGLIKIKILKPKNRLTITIEDNGIGRRESERRKINNQKSAGIRLVKERLESLSKQKNSKFSLLIVDLEDASGVGFGTKVEIIIP